MPTSVGCSYVEKLWSRTPRAVKLTFLSAFVMTILVNGFSYSNILLNADALGRFYYLYDGANRGRWFVQVSQAIVNPMLLPWFTGIISALLIGLGASLTVSALSIGKPIFAITIGALCASFPSLTLLLMHVYSRGSSALAMALMALAVFCIVKRSWGFLPGAVFCALSLGIYQAYLGYGGALLIMCLLSSFLSQQRMDLRTVSLRVLRYVGGLALGVLIYYIIAQMDMAANSITTTGYVTDGIGQVLLTAENLLTVFTQPFTFFLRDSAGQTYTWMPWVFGLLGLVTVGLLAWRLVQGRKIYTPWQWCMIALLLAALLPACNLMFFLSDEVYGRMMYPLVALLILPLLIIDRMPNDSLRIWPSRILSGAEVILLLCMLFINQGYMLFADKTYMTMALAYEKAYAYTVKLSARIEATEGYLPGMPVLLLGKHGRENEPAPASQTLTGGLFDGLPNSDVYENLMICSNYSEFAPIFLGIRYPLLEDDVLKEQVSAIYETEIADMPVYPAAGSILLCDDVVVIRLETDEEPEM